MNNRILKSAESTVNENKNINIELTADKLNASPFEKIVNVKIFKVDAKYTFVRLATHKLQ